MGQQNNKPCHYWMASLIQRFIMVVATKSIYNGVKYRKVLDLVIPAIKEMQFPSCINSASQMSYMKL